MTNEVSSIWRVPIFPTITSSPLLFWFFSPKNQLLTQMWCQNKKLTFNWKFCTIWDSSAWKIWAHRHTNKINPLLKEILYASRVGFRNCIAGWIKIWSVVAEHTNNLTRILNPFSLLLFGFCFILCNSCMRVQ